MRDALLVLASVARDDLRQFQPLNLARRTFGQILKEMDAAGCFERANVVATVFNQFGFACGEAVA